MGRQELLGHVPLTPGIRFPADRGQLLELPRILPLGIGAKPAVCLERKKLAAFVTLEAAVPSRIGVPGSGAGLWCERRREHGARCREHGAQ